MRTARRIRRNRAGQAERTTATAVAVAGVMGGEETEINAATTDVLIESAYFAPASVRRTSKLLGLHTEASHRFERGGNARA